MHFDEKKLAPEAADTLVKCPIYSVQPYSLMLGPVYVFMKRNQKFVSVKAPLDFFTPEELEKLKPYEEFFMPEFVLQATKFQTAAKVVRSLLEKVDLTPYEISDEILKVTSKLWSKELKIEPFFMSIFTDELCGVIDPQQMLEAREKTVAKHDWGLLLSGSVVFLTLWAGVEDIEALTNLRLQTYSKTVQGENWGSPKNHQEMWIAEVQQWMLSHRAIEAQYIEFSAHEWAKKIHSRLKRAKKNYTTRAGKAPSIYGPHGFIESEAA